MVERTLTAEGGPCDVVYVSTWFAPQMGYIENRLPWALARLGLQVQLVTSDVVPFFNSPTYDRDFRLLFGPRQVLAGTSMIDGLPVHRLRHRRIGHSLALRDLAVTLRRIRPKVVQVGFVAHPVALQLALLAPSVGFRLFTGQHTDRFHAVLRPATLRGRVYRFLHRRVAACVDHQAEHCFAVTTDCRNIGVEYFGIPKGKISISPLGYDEVRVHPVQTDDERRARQRLREQAGFSDSDIVCIFTGRVTPQKRLDTFAEALSRLESERFRGLIVGGDAGAYRFPASTRHVPFVPATELPEWFRASDVAVWPSTYSITQAEAVATGLPTILSDRAAKEELLAAGAMTHREGDVDDLTAKLRGLANRGQRQAIGETSAVRMRSVASWESVAKGRRSIYGI